MACYIILNSDGRIHTVSEKDDNVLQPGQTKEISALSMQEFVSSLPDVHSNCVKVGNSYIVDKIEIKEQYNADELIAWAMENVLTSIPDALKALAIAAFLDFANKANDSSKTNFLAIAGSVGLTNEANIIISEAKKRGADISA